MSILFDIGRWCRGPRQDLYRQHSQDHDLTEIRIDCSILKRSLENQVPSQLSKTLWDIQNTTMHQQLYQVFDTRKFCCKPSILGLVKTTCRRNRVEKETYYWQHWLVYESGSTAAEEPKSMTCSEGSSEKNVFLVAASEVWSSVVIDWMDPSRLSKTGEFNSKKRLRRKHTCYKMDLQNTWSKCTGVVTRLPCLSVTSAPIWMLEIWTAEEVKVGHRKSVIGNDFTLQRTWCRKTERLVKLSVKLPLD